jgi:site-specific DNA-methyltransferase (adenine-specific)
VIIARKPLIGTVAANVLHWGTGGLNIDACRVTTGEKLDGGAYSAASCSNGVSGSVGGPLLNAVGKEFVQPGGRWPTNLIHDGSPGVMAAFPDSNGRVGATGTRTQGAVYGTVDGGESGILPRVDLQTSAARFFYCAKASKKDRNEGLECLPKVVSGVGDNRPSGSFNERLGKAAVEPAANHHPTVKPTDLMAYLCRLVTPPGGTVLDPFMGSGSTGKAAMREGFNFIGCELDADYVAIAEARIAAESKKAAK